MITTANRPHESRLSIHGKATNSTVRTPSLVTLVTTPCTLHKVPFLPRFTSGVQVNSQLHQTFSKTTSDSGYSLSSLILQSCTNRNRMLQFPFLASFRLSRQTHHPLSIENISAKSETSHETDKTHIGIRECLCVCVRAHATQKQQHSHTP